MKGKEAVQKKVAAKSANFLNRIVSCLSRARNSSIQEVPVTQAETEATPQLRFIPREAEKKSPKFQVTKKRVILESTPLETRSNSIDAEIENLLAITSPSTPPEVKEEKLLEISSPLSSEILFQSVHQPVAIIGAKMEETQIVSFDISSEDSLEVSKKEEESDLPTASDLSKVLSRFEGVRIEAFASVANDEVSYSFANAAAELAVTPTTEFELSFEQLAVELDHEHIELYFALAQEVFDNPTVLQEYVDEVAISQSRKVDATALELELKKVEQITEAPLFSLKKGSAIPTRGTEEEHVAPTHRFTPIAASFSERFFGGAIDLLLISTLAVVAGFIYSYQRSDTFAESLVHLQFSQIDTLDTILPTTVVLSAFIFLSILYPLISTFLFGRTPGYALQGLKIVTADAQKPEKLNLVVRAFIWPLSLITLGFLSILTTGVARHDRMSKTVVTKVLS